MPADGPIPKLVPFVLAFAPFKTGAVVRAFHCPLIHEGANIPQRSGLVHCTVYNSCFFHFTQPLYVVLPVSKDMPAVWAILVIPKRRISPYDEF